MVLGDFPHLVLYMSVLENLRVNTALGQVQGLVAGPLTSVLQTLISLQSLRVGALL